MQANSNTSVCNLSLIKVIKRAMISLKIKKSQLFRKKECPFFNWTINSLEQNRKWLEEKGYKPQIILYDDGLYTFFYWKVTW